MPRERRAAAGAGPDGRATDQSRRQAGHRAWSRRDDEVQKSVADIDRDIAVVNAVLRLAEIDPRLPRSGFLRVDLAGFAAEVAELSAPLTDEKGADLGLYAA